MFTLKWPIYTCEWLRTNRNYVHKKHSQLTTHRINYLQFNTLLEAMAIKQWFPSTTQLANSSSINIKQYSVISKAYSSGTDFWLPTSSRFSHNFITKYNKLNNISFIQILLIISYLNNKPQIKSLPSSQV